MRDRDAHLSDRELVLAADGELSAARERHLAACWSCLMRRQEMEGAVADFAAMHREARDPLLPAADAPRARLRACLAELAAARSTGRQSWFGPWSAAAVGALHG